MRRRARFPRGQVLVFLLPLLAVLGAAAWWAFLLLRRIVSIRV